MACSGVADPAVAVSSPLMWAAALDAMMARIASRIDVRRLAAIAGSAQQHGSVYLNASATAALAALDPARPLVEQVEPMLSRPCRPSGWTPAPAPNAARSQRLSAATQVWRSTRAPSLRALHRSADPKVRVARAGRVRRDRSDSPRQLVSGLAARRTPRTNRSGRWLRDEPDGSDVGQLVGRGGRGNRTRPAQPSCRHSRQPLPSSGRWRRTGRRDTVSPRRRLLSGPGTIRAA